MNHADPETMRTRARQAIDFLTQQLLRTGTIEPLVAFYFADHIEQVQFEDPSILEHFDARTARSFDYLRTLARINKPQAALITLDVRMGALESEDKEVVADTTAIFVMFDSPLLTIQAIAPYTRSNGRITLQRHLPLPGESDLLPHLEYCYERSIGCVGLVKDWLTRGLSLAMNQGANAVSRKILEKTAWSLDQSERMARETVDGESDVSEKEEKHDRLRHLLRLGATSSATAPAAARVNPPVPQVRRRVGQRKPARDLVGIAKEA